MRLTSVRARSFFSPHDFFNLAAVLGVLHFDEVDDDLATDVAQAELTGDLAGGFDIRLEGHLLEIPLAADLAGVDVHGSQGLGGIEDKTSARRHGRLA